MSQRKIRAVFMRGGTSKALFFHRRDLPAARIPGDSSSWDELFLAALGSPDEYGRQLNGMGGGESSLSKVAIVSPSSRENADVDYTFAQVGIRDRSVGYRGNCGNISSAVGPFAVDEGLVTATGGHATVRIFNTNTSRYIHATFGIAEGRAVVRGDYRMAGVGGSGAPIQLSFKDIGGAVTGRLLPTGSAIDSLQLPDGTVVQASLVDAANPLVCVGAADLGVTRLATPAQLRQDDALLRRIEDLRVTAAVRMGLAESRAEASVTVRNLPLVALLIPTESQTPDATTPHVDITVRMFSAGLPHGAVPLTGAMALATAAKIPGTLPGLCLAHGERREPIRIAHPSGITEVAATVAISNGTAIAREAIVYRTARRLMDGHVYVPD